MTYLRRIGLLAALPAAALLVTACPITNQGGGGTVSQDILDKENQTHNLVNAERTALGISALTMNTNLRNLARDHSRDMVNRSFFGHTNPDGKDPFDRMADAGITYSSAAENIAWNNFFYTVETAVTGWMGSAGHKANILNASFTKTGIGIAKKGTDTYYYTQVFTAGYKKGEPIHVVEGYWVEPDGIVPGDELGAWPPVGE